jgi:hypothetical protein
MSAAPKRKLTVAEYLEIERTAPFKSEFYDGVMYPLHGDVHPGDDRQPVFDHDRLKYGLVAALRAGLSADGPTAVLADQTVVGDGQVVTADIVIVRGRPEFAPTAPNPLVNPSVAIEITAPATEVYDRSRKFAIYRRVPSLDEYLLVSPYEPRVERFLRLAGGSWGLAEFADPTGDFVFDTVRVRMPLADLYRGAEVSPGG